MSELKTDAAEQALAEHVAAVGGQPPYEGTGYHDSIADFRRELAGSADEFRKRMEPYRVKVFAVGAEKADPADATAYMACLMASSYAYTLAAVLGAVHKKFGTDAAREIAWIADDILENGDDEDRNADVRPAVRCKHCQKPITHCGKRAPHTGCSSSLGWIHDNGGGHACEPRSDGPYATPSEEQK